MKKNYLKTGIIISALFLLSTTQSCRKESLQKQQIGHLIPIERNEKTENQYVLFCFLGHDGSKCPGCLLINGKWTHVDCQGAGSNCNKTSRVALAYDLNNNLTAVTLDTFGLTGLNILNMPAESFALEIDQGVYSYLNIPAQLVFRDTATLQFTFTGLFFTDVPEYANY